MVKASNLLKITLVIAVVLAVLTGTTLAIDEITNFSGVHVSGVFGTATPMLMINRPTADLGMPFEIRAENTPVFSVNAAGDLTYSGTPVVNGASYVNAPTSIATTTPALFVNSAGVSNLFEVRDAATPVFAVNNGGAVVVSGPQSLSNWIIVSAPTAIATATPAFVVDSLGVSNILEVRDAATPVFAVNNGGAIVAAGAGTWAGGQTVNNWGIVSAPTAIATATPAFVVDSLGVSNLVEVRDGTTAVFAIHNGGDIDVVGGLPAAAGSADVLDITSTAAAQDGSDVIQVIDINLTGGATTGTGNELIGLDLGLTTADVQSRERAIVADDADWEMAMDAGANPIVSSSQRFMEDAFGAVINGALVLLNGSDGGAVDPAIAQAQYGVIVLDGGDSGASVAADTSELALGRHWQANQGGLIFEARLHTNTDIVDMRMCTGLTDTILLEQPATIAGSDVVTTVADDFVAFCFDTAGDTDVWFALSADSTAAGTGAGATAVAPTADVYQVLRIEIDASGAQARFYIDGVLVKTITAGAVSPDVALGPFVTCQSLAANTQTCDLDYFMVDSKR